ncbi:hypothetical protein RP726_13340 [Candidatus Methylospira mobilis]|nr:hypothetical protein [Candidatus Methylospira mobilis]WNV03435.1 hypothetical protein RP726_13340 [Candidatus Methylospira mobilis]
MIQFIPEYRGRIFGVLAAGTAIGESATARFACIALAFFLLIIPVSLDGIADPHWGQQTPLGQRNSRIFS